ncbi:MAG: TetR/AcrR family transcriptional regulator [Planctomycetes bacterium]|nr:TetR/AcrR family transcriptional regulator [Planctomycetota bacterium]
MVQVLDKERVQARRMEILAAASAVFRERGFHAAGMREIAQRMGVAVGKLYYYFAGKEALLAFCQEDCLGRLLQVVEEAEKASDDPARQLAYIVRGHVRCLNSEVPGSLAHLEVESLAAADRARILRLRRRYERALQKVIERGVSTGCLRCGDPALATRSLLGAMNWTVKWWQPEGRMNLDDLADGLCEHALHGLAVSRRKGGT